MPTSPFNPDPATTDALLQSIAADYSLSLTDIAAQHNTTIEALTAWLTRDDIDERLTAIESACARRARLTAANHLPAVAHVAKQALEEASDVLRLPPDYRTQHSIALRIRATESARKAAALLLRIANFTPGPRRVRYHSTPTSPGLTPPPAPSFEPRAEIEPTTSPTAPRAESAPSAPSAATPTDRAPSAPLTATTLAAPTTSTHRECARDVALRASHQSRAARAHLSVSRREHALRTAIISDFPSVHVFCTPRRETAARPVLPRNLGAPRSGHGLRSIDPALAPRTQRSPPAPHAVAFTQPFRFFPSASCLDPSARCPFDHSATSPLRHFAT